MAKASKKESASATFAPENEPPQYGQANDPPPFFESAENRAKFNVPYEAATIEPDALATPQLDAAAALSVPAAPEPVVLDTRRDRFEAFKLDLYRAQIRHKLTLDISASNPVGVIDSTELTRVRRQLRAGGSVESLELEA